MGIEDRNEIQQMLKSGKINSEQATLLVNAIKESDDRKKKLYADVGAQKTLRQQKNWGFLTVGLIFVALGISVLLFTAMTQRLSRDEVKAVAIFEQSIVTMSNAQLEKSEDIIKKGIRKAPGFALGYALLAKNYESKNDKDQAHAAWQKAQALAEERSGRNMNGIAVFFLLVLMVLVVGVLSLICMAIYNVLVNREEKVNEDWTQVANVCQRKVDLVPALSLVVKEYAEHEQGTLQSVVEARDQLKGLLEKVGGVADVGKPQINEILASQKGLDSALGNVFALSEKYPDLKADAHYLTMQQQLEEAENIITNARQKYNKDVKSYNTALRVFPYQIIASCFGFQAKSYFEQA